MAGDWIKLRTDLQDDQEVLRLSSMTKLDRFSVVGRLSVLWGWADKHTTDGRAPVTQLLLDELISCPGFCDAMIVVGWLEVDDKGVRFPKFSRHNGKSAKKRALTARRVATHKKRNANAEVTLTALPREEKRRDTNKTLRVVNDTAFVRFWNLWPKGGRKVAKSKCQEVWARKGLDPLVDAICVHVEAMKVSDQWRRGYDPAPLTYLNQQRWLDGAPERQPTRLAI